ncbi:MAG: hypothetical protein SGJ11_03680 [Phycisphaerae bacterium]|nr:hypothetical protein [Phycisphaerae bacterium]
MADVTDKKRLRQVQQQDLTESRLNDDFVFWLKTKGMNWLLGFLVIACAYSFWNFYKQRKTTERDVAWSELSSAALPESFAEVAKKHESIDSVALVAWLAAADSHLRDLQTGLDSTAVLVPNLDGTPAPPQPLSDDGRKLAQDAADSYYQKILDAAASRSGEVAMKPIILSALFGRAAVAESRGAMDVAKQMLEQAVATAGDAFPTFAKEASARLESLSLVAGASALPTRASLPVREVAAPLAPDLTNELLRSLQEPIVPASVAPPAVPPTEPPSPPAEPQ